MSRWNFITEKEIWEQMVRCAEDDPSICGVVIYQDHKGHLWASRRLAALEKLLDAVKKEFGGDCGIPMCRHDVCAALRALDGEGI